MLVFFIITGVITLVVSGYSTFKNLNNTENNQIVKKDTKKPDDTKKIKRFGKKVDPKEKKKEVKKLKPKPTPKSKDKEKVTEVILPDLNLKTQTVLNLFEDVNYDLNKVRFEKSKANLLYAVSKRFR